MAAAAAPHRRLVRIAVNKGEQGNWKGMRAENFNAQLIEGLLAVSSLAAAFQG